MSVQSPFHWKGTPLQADWSGIVRSSNNSAASTATVARKRKAGEDPGAIEGLSDKGDKLISVFAQKRHGGAYSRANKTR